MGTNLGAANYRLCALIESGLVKASNFSRNPNKLGEAYVLTPAGDAEKSLLTGRFLTRKMAEYEPIKMEIDLLSREATARAGEGTKGDIT